MTLISSPVKDDFEHLRFPAQINVSQGITGLLQQSRPFQTNNIKHIETISIRAIESEYRQAITTKPLTASEVEVLQLIVEEHRTSQSLEGSTLLQVQ